MKNILAKPLMLLVVVSMMLPYRANAGIPTIDITNIVQTTVSAIENIEQVIQLYEQIDNQINQIENQVKAFENLNGDYLKHALLNSGTHQQARRWVPKTYNEVLDLYKNINVAGYEKTTNAGWDARDSMHVTDAADIYADVDSNSAQRWQQHENDSMAAVGVAESSFERVDEVLAETELLMEDIQNSPDAKASQDLQNRMSGQTQILLAEVIRIQSTQAATQGRNQLYEHARKGEDKRRAIVDELPTLL